MNAFLRASRLFLEFFSLCVNDVKIEWVYFDSVQ